MFGLNETQLWIVGGCAAVIVARQLLPNLATWGKALWAKLAPSGSSSGEATGAEAIANAYRVLSEAGCMTPDSTKLVREKIADLMLQAENGG